MAHAMTYATVAAVSIVGAGLGVYMGRAAISEINPIYYQPLPATRFFSDLSPTTARSVDWNTEVPADYWANDLNVGGRLNCNDCPVNFVDPGFAEIAPAAASRSYRDDEPNAPMPEAATRYADFSISREEAVRTVDSFPEEQANAAPDDEDVPVGM